MSSQLSFCVIVPMYNEEVGVERCVRAICQELETFRYRTALIVVNDGSTDRTGPILKQLEEESPSVVLVTHERNAGYGRAIQTGIRQATVHGFAYALFMDSDLTNDPKYIPAFVAHMLRGIDVIKGSRYVAGGGMVGVPVYRALISVVGNRLAGWLMGLPVRDCTNGFRAVKLGTLSKMQLTETGFSVIMQELYFAKFLGATFSEVPHTLTSRTADQGRSRFRYRPKVFAQYLKYPIKAFLGIGPPASSRETSAGRRS